jgi:hypothetical protein
MVLGKHGYETTIRGKNRFVCMVQRSWAGGFDDPEFWNPTLRAPICFNPPAVRSYLPLILKKTDLVLAGRSKAQMIEMIGAAIEKKELPSIVPGAMGYMLSEQGYLSYPGIRTLCFSFRKSTLQREEPGHEPVTAVGSPLGDILVGAWPDDVLLKVITTLREGLIRTGQISSGSVDFPGHIGKPLSPMEKIVFTVPRSGKYRPEFVSMAEPPSSDFLSALEGCFEKGPVPPSPCCPDQRITSAVSGSSERTRETNCRPPD